MRMTQARTASHGIRADELAYRRACTPNETQDRFVEVAFPVFVDRPSATRIRYTKEAPTGL